MQMYRALVNLDKGGVIIEKGSIFPESGFQPAAINRLYLLNKIAPVSAPPLNELPGWKTRAKKLEKVEITQPSEFLAADDDELAETLDLDVEKVELLKQDLINLLEAPRYFKD